MLYQVNTHHITESVALPKKNWLSRLSWIQLQEIFPDDFFVLDHGYHDDEDEQT
jgi:hypothetical protein